ncbi:release factor glutamine methyltransferase [Acrasis kona]|uniref:Release factor glutamine methyltransferase n=1 Tax=Acrasis kona TaxID=1008807 RepID=A0AAW2ZRH6_9EUKA
MHTRKQQHPCSSSKAHDVAEQSVDTTHNSSRQYLDRARSEVTFGRALRNRVNAALDMSLLYPIILLSPVLIVLHTGHLRENYQELFSCISEAHVSLVSGVDEEHASEYNNLKRIESHKEKHEDIDSRKISRANLR